MEAGTLRHKVTIQQITGSTNSFGEIDKDSDGSWGTYCTRRAAILNPSAAELSGQDQQFAEATHVVELRFDNRTRRITPEMRVNWDDNGTTRILNIQSVTNPANKRRSVLLSCKEEV